MNNQQLWLAVLGELEVTISKANFTTWFKGTFIIEISNDEITIGVPNNFTKSWLEKKYTQDILAAIRKITQNSAFKTIKVKVESIKNQTVILDVEKLTAKIAVEPEKKQSATLTFDRPAMAPTTQTHPSMQFGLNPRYFFDNFIVGKGNELAKAAAHAVAGNPGQSYNPLFIYGPAGLGKTHLMHAIGNEIIKKFGSKKILYITCEKFTNDFIGAVQSGKAASFKDLYRSVDVLLVDDIQFLAGKEQTQEEFFHTFNALHQNNKQVVISSDRPPKSIPALEARLLSRFEWGMIADISQPDLETRKAILKLKSGEKNYNLSEEILDYIANNVASNVRELEGALNRLIAYHQLNNVVLSVDTARTVLSAYTTNTQKKPVTVKEIVNTVASYYDIAIADIMGKCRNKNLVVPRQIVMYLLRQDVECSYPTIGHELGGRDHTTAMHACNKISRDYKENEKTRREIEQIREKLYQY